jgi:hypothetical protein
MFQSAQPFSRPHDPPKRKRFGDKILRTFDNLECDRTQSRAPLLRIAL